MRVNLGGGSVLVDPAPEVVLGELLRRGEQLLVRHEALQYRRDRHAVHAGYHLAGVVGQDRRHDGGRDDGVEVRSDVGVHAEVSAGHCYHHHEELRTEQ